SVHSSIITYPLSVHGASANGDELREMAGRALLLTVFVGVGVSPILAGVVWALNRTSVIPWALFALFLWQMQETARRAFMAQQRFREVFWGDGLCYLGQAAAIWILSEAGIIDLKHAFGIIAVTSLLAGGLQLKQLRPRIENPFLLRMLMSDFWLLGRWVLMINLLNLLTIQALPWMLMFSHGAEDVAAFQAMGNILAVANPVIYCMGNLMLPVSAKVNAAQGVRTAWQRSRIYAAQGGVLLLPYFAALLFWPDRFLGIFYGSDSLYSGLGWPLRILVLAYICNYLAQVVGVFLNGIREGRSAFQAQAASALAVLLSGPPLVLWAGVVGALSGTAIMNGVRAAFSIGFLSQKLRCSADAR
ncbi:MAG: polysaccharide biosynthesis C-terminal domain-containing protein, partial [Methanothrix sp.]|nr:polysaccharide biosynthesis C-terminal domain-containing protein [Methanothrix sp.]